MRASISIILSYNGKQYRPILGNECNRKCSLFKHGVCDNCEDTGGLPCDRLVDALIEAKIYNSHYFKEIVDG